MLFGPRDVKVYQNLHRQIPNIVPLISMLNVYVMSAQTAYVDKTRKNETADLWHASLGHVSYTKLKVMMNKSMLKGLPELDVKEDIIFVGCQFD